METASPRRSAYPHLLLRMARLHIRLWLAFALAAVLLTVLPAHWRFATRWLIAWDVAVAGYLAACAVMMARSDLKGLRQRAAEQDEGAGFVMMLTTAAALTSMVAIVAQLGGPAKNGQYSGLHIALAIATILLSWTFTHVIFALRYAYEYYDDEDCVGGLDFPGEKEPDYWDFIYFAFVIGMTFQVSDVAVQSRKLRKMVVGHGAVSFVFNTTILALTVNIAGSLI
jgi:uncharacterized membrane protein